MNCIGYQESYTKECCCCVLQKGRKDAVNFDAEFTKEDPVLTPINQEVVRAINQDEFRGFSCINSAFKSAAAAPSQA